MRLVIVPIITFSNTEGESEFVMFRQFARDITKRFDAFVYLIVPESARKQIVPEPRIHYVYEGEVGNFFDTQADIPTSLLQLFSPRRGEYVVDAVMTSRTNAAAYMSRCLWDARGDRIPVFVDESMAADFESLVSPITDDVDLMNRSLGYACAAGSFFDTNFERENALKAARRYLTGSAYQMVERKLHTVPCGISIDKLEKAKANPIRPKTFTIGMGGRLNAMKRADNLVEILDKFYCGGRDARIVLTTPKEDNFFEGDVRKQYPEIDVLNNVPSHEFVRMAAGWNIMLNTSRIEGFSVGFMEQLYLVPVVIMPRLPWTRDLLGEHFDKYPFLYDNFGEAATMLRWCYQNYEEAKAKAAFIKPWVAATYDSKSTNERMYKIMLDQAVTGFRSRLWTKGNVELLEKVLEALPAEFALLDFQKEIVRRSECYRITDFDNPSRGKLSRWHLYKYLLFRGFKDTTKNEEPFFVRPSVCTPPSS